jgi:serine O-acetyltransferase
MNYCPYENPILDKGAKFEKMVDAITLTYQDSKGINHIEGFNLPNESEVIEILQQIMELIFPGYTGRKKLSMQSIKYFVGDTIAAIYPELLSQIMRAVRYNCSLKKCENCDVFSIAENSTTTLLESIPKIRKIMKIDVLAAYEGDPAAASMDEIILSYPGIKAITIQRIAHILYKLNTPLIPRLLTEYAHRMTGIDIHPGAVLGEGVFIDHGTGVVIGETAVIGNNVKIYQGVTLGALSFPKDSCGKIIKGAKRHPTIENDVTIYSGATILGDINIASGSVIGGNVWLTKSLSPGTKVTIAPPELTIKSPTSK